MQNKKKRKLKKGFKRFVFIFSFFIIILFILFLNKEKIINLNNIWQNTKTIFIKDKNSNEINNQNINTNDFVSVFKNRLQSKGLEFNNSGEILSNGDMKIFLKNENDNSSYIYINTNDKAEYVWITFVSAIDAEPLKTKLKNKLTKLDYIDLRFSNKVFYKFKDEILDITPSTDMNNDQNIIENPPTNEEIRTDDNNQVLPASIMTMNEVASSTNNQ